MQTMRAWTRTVAAAGLMLALLWGPFGSSLLASHLARDASRDAADCCPGTHPDGMCPRHPAPERAVPTAPASAPHFRCECTTLWQFVMPAAPPVARPAPDVPIVIGDVLVAETDDPYDLPFVPATPPPKR
jgi:hypothetical protein